MVDHKYISGSMVMRKWQLAEKELAFLLLGVEKTEDSHLAMYPVLGGVEASLVDNPVWRVVESCSSGLYAMNFLENYGRLVEDGGAGLDQNYLWLADVELVMLARYLSSCLFCWLELGQ